LKKVKLSLCLTKCHAMKTYWGEEVQLHAFLPSALHGGERSASRSGRFTPVTHYTGGWVGPQHPVTPRPTTTFHFTLNDSKPMYTKLFIWGHRRRHIGAPPLDIPKLWKGHNIPHLGWVMEDPTVEWVMASPRLETQLYQFWLTVWHCTIGSFSLHPPN